MDYKRMSWESLVRLLRDFPWLWSIRTHWQEGSVYAKVMRAEIGMMEPESFCSRQFYECNEVWTHCYSKDEGEWVKKIKQPNGTGVPIASIIDWQVDPSFIKHVACVVKETEILSYITIYRPPKPDKNFKKFFGLVRKHLW